MKRAKAFLLLLLLLFFFTQPIQAKTQLIFLIDVSASIDILEYHQIHLALQAAKLPEKLRSGTVVIVEWSTGPVLVGQDSFENFENLLKKYWQNGRTSSGSTGVGYALNFVMQEIFDPTAHEHYVILITDGDNNSGPHPLETNYRTWSIINKVNTSVIVIDNEDWLVQYYQPLRIGFKSLIIHAKDFDQLKTSLQLLVNSIFAK